MNRTQVEVALNRSRADVLEGIAGLDDPALQVAATPSEHDPSLTWNLADHLSHIAVVERWRTGLIRAHLLGESADNPFLDAQGNFRPREELWADVNRRNEEWARAHRTTDRGELVRLGLEVRADTLTLMAGLTDDEWAAVLPGLPFQDSSVAGILVGNVGHSQAHLDMVRAALAGKGIRVP